jgi:hypothetical protein
MHFKETNLVIKMMLNLHGGIVNMQLQIDPELLLQ